MFSPARQPVADLALDVGSEFVRVALRGRGLVAEHPSTVALQEHPGGRRVAAFGDEARRMLGRSGPGLRVVQPVRCGVVDDYEAAEHLFRATLNETGVQRPRVLAAVPTSATEVQRRALQESIRAAGAREVTLLASAHAAAIGIDVPLFEPAGTLLISIGGGLAEACVASLGGIVVHGSAAHAGDALDVHLVHWMRRHHDILIGKPTAERVKMDIGAARGTAHPRRARVRGRDLADGSPRTVDLDARDVSQAYAPVLDELCALVRGVLAKTPPELSGDIHGSGALLTGSTSQLPGLDGVLGDTIGLPCVVVDAPGRAVARGLTRILDDPDLLSRLLDA